MLRFPMPLRLPRLPSLPRLAARVAAVLVATLVLGACATPKYRYDRKKERHGVEVKDLEDLIEDSKNPDRAPGRGLNLDKKTLEFDFTQRVDEYKIGKNDVLNIFVVDHPEMSSQRINLGEIAGTTVHKDGFVHMPVIGKLKAEGLSIIEFADALQAEAGKYLVSPAVSVEMLHYASQKFYVLGMVPKPGAFPVDGDTTLLEGLGLAGGVAPEGDLEGAYVLRNNDLLPISLADMMLRGDVTRNIFMRDGDVVFVPDNADKKVYVLGEVREPSVVPITREKVTLAEALATAGGPTMAEGRSEMSILRGGHAKPIVYTVDMEDALLFDEQIALRPGDRVIVAPTGLSTASKYMKQILPFLQGVQALGIATQGATNTVNTAAAIGN